MKRLYRSRTEKMLAGVCGGIGEYFEIDPTMVRLAWVLFGFLGGSGIVAYIIAMIVVPQMPMGYTQPGPEGTWEVGGDKTPPRDAQYTSYQCNQQGQPNQQAQQNPQGQPYYGQQSPPPEQPAQNQPPRQ